MKGGESVKASELSQADVARLVDLSRQGDRSAYDQLVDLYHDRILNYVVRMVHDPIEAEDITQEAFIKAYCNLPGFCGNSAFYSWLYRIASNLVIDSVRRRRKRGNTYSLDAPLDTEKGQMGREQEDVDDLGPLESLESAELLREVYRAIDKLSKKLRDALVLYQLMGLKYEEIADVLGCSLEAVKGRIFKARLEVAKLLLEAGLMDEEEMQRLYAQRPNLIPAEPKRKYTRRQAPAPPKEDTEMSADFKDRWDKIKGKSIMTTVRHGFPVINGKSGETIEEHFAANYQMYLDSEPDPDREETTDLMDIADALLFNSSDLKKHLQGIATQNKAQNDADAQVAKQAQIAKAIVFENPEGFIAKLCDPANIHQLPGTISIWEYLGDLTLDIKKVGVMEQLARAGELLNAPVGALILAGLTYLYKSLGQDPGVELPGGEVELYEAFLNSGPGRRLEMRLNRLSLPEELDDQRIKNFLASKVAGHTGLSVCCVGSSVELAESTTVAQALALLKGKHARLTAISEAVVSVSGMTAGQFATVYEKVIPVAPKPTPAPISPPTAPPTTDPVIASVPTTPQPPLARTAVPVPPVALTAAPDPTLPPTSLTPGVFVSARGVWQRPVSDYLRNTHPFFTPADTFEKAEEWACRMSRKGISIRVIAYLLSGSELTRNAVQVMLHSRHNAADYVPKEEEASKYLFLDNLLPAELQSTQGKKNSNPISSPVSAPTPPPSPLSPTQDLAPAPVPAPSIIPEPTPTTRRLVSEVERKLFASLGNYDHQVLSDALASVLSGLTIVRLMGVAERCERAGGPIKLKPIQETGEPEE